MDVKSIDVMQVRQVVKEYDATVEELDNRVSELEVQMKEIDAALVKERDNLRGPNLNDKLNKRAVIGVFARVEGEVEIVLIYGKFPVSGAFWTPGYDIRVDTGAREEPVTLIYKAGITQNTGEDWENISLTLETATPTFGVNVPKLDPWNLSIYTPVMYVNNAPAPAAGYLRTQLMSANGGTKSKKPLPFGSNLQEEYGEEIEHRGLEVVSKGTVSATFQVPGLITIPSDGVAHNVTIVQLYLGATMSWVCVPKKDTKMHLSVASMSTVASSRARQSLLSALKKALTVPWGKAFHRTVRLPLLSMPDRLDPSIRVTYHPRAKKQSESGFYTKTKTHVFTQSITVHNTNSTAASRVRIAEQIPVSEDTQIQVKLVSPALVLKEKEKSEKDNEGAEKVVAVAKGVSAMWDGADDPAVDVNALGMNGMFNWVCAVPAQGKINLVLQYEVVTPARTNVVGLA
ncbi:hypothetical protein C0991_001818 [Blastosporella zonata]|nr:hypothetical protein C0991_001818 [Blastosporella zonata]